MVTNGKRLVDHICENIPIENFVRGSKESRQPQRSWGLMFKMHITSVAQLPAPDRDSSLSTTGASLGDVHPRTHIRTRLQKRKEDERRNKAESKAKRQHTSIERHTQRK